MIGDIIMSSHAFYIGLIVVFFGWKILASWTGFEPTSVALRKLHTDALSIPPRGRRRKKRLSQSSKKWDILIRLHLYNLLETSMAKGVPFLACWMINNIDFVPTSRRYQQQQKCGLPFSGAFLCKTWKSSCKRTVRVPRCACGACFNTLRGRITVQWRIKIICLLLRNIALILSRATVC